MEMETKLDSRQGQFPASFPDTFKNFFAMMNEDEDHMDLFSNLLEDKVIPKANKFQQRRYGGSLRCTSNPHRQGVDGDRGTSLSSGYGSGGSNSTHNVGRSNSFRFNRPRNAFSTTSSTGLNSLGVLVGGSASTGGEMGVAGGITCTAAVSHNKLSGSSSSLLCKHIKYCCLHQQQQKSLTQTLPACNQQQQLFQQQPTSSPATQQLQQQPSIHFVQKSYHSDYTAAQTSNGGSNNCCNSNNGTSLAGAATSVSTRLGPDGEDNTTSGLLNNGLTNCLANGPFHQHHQQFNHAHHQQSSSSNALATNSQQNKLQQQQQQQQQQQKRHSIILERAFDFDASCDESDTISTTSSTPTTTNIPYNILKPILKQPKQQQQQQQQNAHQIHVIQQNTSTAATTMQPKSILKDNSQHHLQQHHIHHQQQQQQQQQIHRTLPQPPKNAGPGAYHTRETALQRIQQQSGLLYGSRTNLSNLCGANPLGPIISTSTGTGTAPVSVPLPLPAPTPATTINHYSTSAVAAATAAQPQATATVALGDRVTGGIAVTNRSCSTCNMTTVGIANSTNNCGTFATGSGFMELHSPSHVVGSTSSSNSSFNKLNETLINTHANSLSTSSTRNNLQSIRTQKSPILNRRRSSSIVANLLTADFTYNQTSTSPASSPSNVATLGINDNANMCSLSHSNTRKRIKTTT